MLFKAITTSKDDYFVLFDEFSLSNMKFKSLLDSTYKIDLYSNEKKESYSKIFDSDYISNLKDYSDIAKKVYNHKCILEEIKSILKISIKYNSSFQSLDTYTHYLDNFRTLSYIFGMDNIETRVTQNNSSFELELFSNKDMSKQLDTFYSLVIGLRDKAIDIAKVDGGFDIDCLFALEKLVQHSSYGGITISINNQDISPISWYVMEMAEFYRKDKN